VARVRVVIAPDGFGGVLPASAVAGAIAEGWRRVRPDDELDLLPLSDGGEGLLDVLARDGDTTVEVEVAGPHGHPLHAPLLLREDGTAVVESALACGLALVPEEQRSPMPATTYGVGQLVEAARGAGAQRILVGLGGSASVDGGTGALNGLGFRLRVEDGSGLKVGGADLHRVRRVEPTWVAELGGIDVELLADVDVVLADAAPLFGPQKGATPEQVEQLTRALEIWADVAERDLGAAGARQRPGAGAAGGLGFGLAVGLDAPLLDGAARVAELVGLEQALSRADLVVTGEGRLDATSLRGKVVGHLLERAEAHGLPLRAVVGRAERDAAGALDDVEAASPQGPGDDPWADAATAAGRLAERVQGP
jgi:glycerate 2-kinase